MRINTGQFCSLSSNPTFLGWLGQTCPQTHAELTDHLRKGLGCQANATKMNWVLGELSKSDELMQKLGEFLRAKLPQVLELPQSELKPDGTPASVFGVFDPKLLTIPRRAVFKTDEDADDFLRGIAIFDRVRVDGKTYVEYLTADLAHLLPQVPSRNWMIKAWRRTYGLSAPVATAKLR